MKHVIDAIVIILFISFRNFIVFIMELENGWPFLFLFHNLTTYTRNLNKSEQKILFTHKKIEERLPYSLVLYKNFYIV